MLSSSPSSPNPSGVVALPASDIGLLIASSPVDHGTAAGGTAVGNDGHYTFMNQP